MSRNWIIAGVAAVCLVTGAALSHRIEPGVRVEKIMLTTNTPALRLFPATPGPHPIVLLAHGNGGSKETLFRYGEALAAASFDCYSVDQAGYGESPQAWGESPQHWRGLHFQELERALGGVDVFIGHSMGAARGSRSVREAGFRPKLFIGVGFPSKLGEHGPPLLLLAGYLRNLLLIDQPGYDPSQMRRLSFLPGPNTSSKCTILSSCAPLSKPRALRLANLFPLLRPRGGGDSPGLYWE